MKRLPVFIWLVYAIAFVFIIKSQIEMEDLLANGVLVVVVVSVVPIILFLISRYMVN